MTFAVWITGLPGSGKSAIAEALLNDLKKHSINATYFNMDLIRKKLVEKPEYSNKERDIAYKKFADSGISEYAKGKNVIYDATAHKLKYRNHARKRIKKFVEIYVKCPLSICIKRETKRKSKQIMAELYKKALIRKRKGKKFKRLGRVIGIDVRYQENKKAELAIKSDKINPSKAAKIIFTFLKSKNYIT